MMRPVPCLLALLAAGVWAHAALLDDFEDGDTSGWRPVGAGPLMQRYSITAHAPGCDSAFCLRVTMNGNEGWCGVEAPTWRKLPVTAPTALGLDARGEGGCAQLLIDLHQSGGARYWRLVPLPADGAWLHVEARPADFFPVDKTDPAKTPPDLAKVAAIWLTLWQSDTRAKAAGHGGQDPPPAYLDLDNVRLVGAEETPPVTPTAPSPPPVPLPRVTALVARTERLQRLGQDPAAPAAVAATLTAAGARVRRVDPGALELSAAPCSSVLIWEGPVCREGDWAQVEAFLRCGGALLWWGAGEPFARPVSPAGAALPQTQKPTRALTEGVLQGLHPLQAEGPWTLTGAGGQLWPGLPRDLAPAKCRFLTTNDSVYRQTLWPWVEATPLLTIDYQASNWISLERTFTGSVATLLRHHAGRYAGARVLLASLGNSAASPLCPRSPLFSAALTGAVRALAAPVRVMPTPAPPARAPVTRASFFSHPRRVLGALDFGVRTWDSDDVREAVGQLGLNLVVPGVPWLDQPTATGQVVDLAVTDRLVADARAGGFAVVFDPYCFGYGRFPWACEDAGKPSAPASIHSATFRRRFVAAMRTLAARYAADPTVVGMFATPDTGTPSFTVEDSEVGRAAWAAYAAQHGLPPDLPAAPKPGGYDLSPARAAYVEFWFTACRSFMAAVIGAIRAQAPDMPLLMRGPWLDVSASCQIAAQYSGVAPHCESVETTDDVEATMRGFGQRYGVPISAENGWPKERGAALRMTCATVLLGGYNDLLISFGGPLWARPGREELAALTRVWPRLRGATYCRPAVGLLIPEPAAFAGEPLGFLGVEGRPHLECFSERCGIQFVAVSAQWPKLDGLRVLLDDGRNEILPAPARRALADWVRAGGTLVGFPGTGSLDAAGGPATLAGGLDLSFIPGRHAVGAGQVVILAQVPTSETGPAADALRQALAQAGLRPRVAVDQPVNQAVFQKDGHLFVVLYDKSRDLVGSFFTENTGPTVEAALPTRELALAVPAGMTSARELVTDRPLVVRAGRIRLSLPPTQWRVVELSR